VFVIDRWYNAEGNYQIQKQNAMGCDSIYTVIIEQRPIFSTYDTVHICQGDTIEIFGFTISEEKDVEQSYVGSNDCDSTVYMHIGVLPQSSSQSQITLCPGDSVQIAGNWVKTSGTYQEILTGNNGCDSTSNIEIIALEKPDDPTIEIDCDIPQITAAIDAPAPWHIQWDTGDTTTATTYKSGNTASVILTTNTGCQLEYTVDLPPLPAISGINFPKDTVINEESQLIYDLGLNYEEWSVHWTTEAQINCDSCMQVQIDITENTEITVLLTHLSGCTYSHTFTIDIKEKELTIPNIFTPDGDGINDIWRIDIPKNIKILSCSIFDRWGEKIYHTKNEINWDGKYKSGSVLSGVYVYIIEYEDREGDKQVVVGDVTVVR
ncbi:MAG TPA: gliding motility-associated C-terminal domain-containing protein, partial [Bacteroidetes bacterium]|nr:gliding motility-associated C-terminal domain-containing protein [Bacteroidota bacterium]